MALARLAASGQWDGLCEAHLADLDLTVFVERGLYGPRADALSARRSCDDRCGVGWRTGSGLASNLREVTECAAVASGPGERISWSVLEAVPSERGRRYYTRSCQHMAPRLRPCGADAVAAELTAAV